MTTVTHIDVRRYVDEQISDTAEQGSTLDQYVELTLIKRQLEASINRLKKELAPRQQELLEEYGERGTRGETHDRSGKSVSINRTLRAQVVPGVERPEAAAALARAGMSDYLEESFNLTKLSAHFRAEEKQATENADGVLPDPDELIPDELKGFIQLFPDTKLGVAS